jgi:uncharacterized OB-fold protein
MDELKTWIFKMKNGLEISICPYCGRQNRYPYNECIICHKKVEMPSEDVAKVIERRWW